jgi:hypothetical protein
MGVYGGFDGNEVGKRQDKRMRSGDGKAMKKTHSMKRSTWGESHNEGKGGVEKGINEESEAYL